MSDERRDHALAMIETAAADTVTTVSYTCPTGQTMKIIGAWGLKSDANARTCQFTLNDGTGAHEISTVRTLTAVAERDSLYYQGNLGDSLILHPGWILQWMVSACAAGCHITLLIVAEVRSGETCVDDV